MKIEIKITWTQHFVHAVATSGVYEGTGCSLESGLDPIPDATAMAMRSLIGRKNRGEKSCTTTS